MINPVPMNMRRLANINCIEVTHEDLGFAPTTNPDLVILFHGYGADAYDLQTLSDVLRPKKPTDFLFPQGVLEVPIGPGWTGRAWWNIVGVVGTEKSLCVLREYRSDSDRVFYNVFNLWWCLSSCLDDHAFPRPEDGRGGDVSGGVMACVAPMGRARADDEILVINE